MYTRPDCIARTRALPQAPRTTSPDFRSFWESNECRTAGIAAGIHTGSLDYTKRYLEQGFNLVTLGTDSAFMARLAAKELADAKETKEARREQTGY